MMHTETSAIELLWDDIRFKQIMKQYNVRQEDITFEHPFVQEFLLPLLQTASDEITMIHNHSDPRHTQVAVEIIKAQDNHESSHEYDTYTTILRYDKSLPVQYLANSLWHETEHANQTLGRGYSKNEQVLIGLSRIHYDSDRTLYLNNFVELRARMAAIKMHINRFNALNANPDTTIEEKESLIAPIGMLKQRLVEALSEDVTEQWVNACTQHVAHINRFSKEKIDLMNVFPAAKDLKTAKKLALDFLTNKAQSILTDCVHAVRARYDDCEHIQQQVADERRQIEMECTKRKVLEIAQALNIPTIQQRPNNPPLSYKQPLNTVSNAEKLLTENHLHIFNRAIIEIDSELYVVGDLTDTHKRDYVSPMVHQHTIINDEDARTSTTQSMKTHQLPQGPVVENESSACPPGEDLDCGR